MTQDNPKHQFSRRQFFRRFLGPGEDTQEGTQPQGEALTGEDLRQAAPTLKSGSAFGIEGNNLVRRNTAGDQNRIVCQLDNQDRFIMRLFDGRHAVGEIADEMVTVFGLAPQAAYEKVTALFLKLAANGLC